MRTIRKHLGRLAIIGGLVGLLNFIQAAGTIKPVQLVSADDMAVMLQAVEQTTPTPAESVPLGATLYSAQNPKWPPYPGNINNLPAWNLGDNVFLMDDLDFDYTSTRVQSLATSVTALSVPLPGDGSDDGTNTITAGTSSVALPDYGTNLWIANFALSGGNAAGKLSNTLSDVKYEIQYKTDLASDTQWLSAGFVLGSEVTNWTVAALAATSLTNNAFFRIRNWADSTGCGIPDWWQLEYFGYVGVDPNAQDPAGDGWTIWQDFEAGCNPLAYRTPPTPVVTASLNADTVVATVSWLPMSGPILNYTLEKHDWQTGITTDYTLSSNTCSFTDDLSADVTLLDGNPQIYVDYSVQAHYAYGDSEWGTAQLDNIGTPSVKLIRGAQGYLNLVFSALPSDLRNANVYYEANTYTSIAAEDYEQYQFDDVIPTNAGYIYIPENEIINGSYSLSQSQFTPYYKYDFYVQIVRSNGACSCWLPLTYYGHNPMGNALFADARPQLKDNLRFLMRAATESGLFSFHVKWSSNPYAYSPSYNWQSNYVYAGFYCSGYNPYGSYLRPYDCLRPLVDNYFYRNIIFNRTDLNPDGSLDTGILSDDGYYLTNCPKYIFDVAAFITNNDKTVPSSLLTAEQTGWIFPLDQFSDLPEGARNWFGLAYQSVEIVNYSDDLTFYPGDSLSDGFLYQNVVQPDLRLVEYYFARPNSDLMPEVDGFSITNTSDFKITPVGYEGFTVAGYAKLAIQNGYSDAFGYLGQYFANAYKIDTNGNVTTNTTGILSPYGDFFATEPGPAALVTMPDIDTGTRGTCTVYCVSLVLDKNHDGTMDTYFSGADTTSANSPCIFWVNGNYDRFTTDADDGVQYDDDVAGNTYAAGCPYTPGVPTPDYNYKDGAGHRVIPCARDLQDFTRLWVCGITTNLLAALPAGSTITLNWGDVGNPNSGNPTIDLFAAADTDGGIGYLTNSTTAVVQTIEPYIGRLGPGQSIQLNASTFANNWAGNHFIWCGVSNGMGGLTLTIADGSGNTLAQSTAYIQLVNITQMYERWTIGDTPSIAPKTNAIAAVEDLPAGTSAFQYTPPQDTNTPYILFVHGWNMTREDKDRFAEAAFKRLYWQGYQGRFGEFRWPTENGFKGTWTQLASNPSEKDNYDRSEYSAWRAGTGLLNKLKDLNAEYPGHVYLLAHSMGNVVAGEALRLAGSSRVVNTYMASQGAVSAHTYDANTNHVPNYSFMFSGISMGPTTPNIYGNWFATNSGSGAGTIVNFYNTNDYALQRSVWQVNQLLKPDVFVLEGGNILTGTTWTYAYLGSPNDTPPWTNFMKAKSFGITAVYFDIANVLTNRYEVMALAAQSYTTALGATPGVQNLNRSVLLTRTSPSRIWPADSSGHNYSDHFWHSAEFRGDYWQMQGYWSELLGTEAFNLK